MSFVDIKAMAPKAEEKAAEGGKGNGKGKEKKEKVPAKLWSKEYALKQISSLDAENDDHRESVSKIISWILRKGHAANIGITMVEKQGDALGFAKVSELAANFLFEDFMKDDRSEAALLKIIESSNEDKKRYETKDIDGSTYVGAVKRTDRKLAEKAKGAATGSSSLQVAQSTALRAEAPEFNPGDSSKAYSAGYSQFPGWGSYPGYGYNQYAYAQMWAAAAAAQAAQSPGEKRYTGRIKSYNAEKGFGFIQSDEAYQFYKRDVFLHKAHLGSFAVNSTVSFKVEVNKEGMPQARDLAASEGEKGGKGKGKGKGKKGEGKGKEAKGKKAKDKVKEGGDEEAGKEEEKPAEEKKDDAKAEDKPAEEKKD